MKVKSEITAQNIYSLIKNLGKDERRSLKIRIFDKTNDQVFTVSSVEITDNNTTLLFVFE